MLFIVSFHLELFFLDHRFLHQNIFTFNERFECFINIMTRKSRSFQIQQLVEIYKVLNSLFFDISILQITFISQKHDSNIRLSIISKFR